MGLGRPRARVGLEKPSGYGYKILHAGRGHAENCVRPAEPKTRLNQMLLGGGGSSACSSVSSCWSSCPAPNRPASSVGAMRQQRLARTNRNLLRQLPGNAQCHPHVVHAVQLPASMVAASFASASAAEPADTSLSVFSEKSVLSRLRRVPHGRHRARGNLRRDQQWERGIATCRVS